MISFFLSRLCAEFEQIAEKALSTPMDTAELVELKEYMHKVETETVLELEGKLQQAGERLAFLIEYSISSPQEMRLTQFTLCYTHNHTPFPQPHPLQKKHLSCRFSINQQLITKTCCRCRCFFLLVVFRHDFIRNDQIAELPPQ